VSRRHHQGATSEELAEIEDLEAEVRRLEADNATLRTGPRSSARGSSAPQSLIVAFGDELRADGHAVEPICRVLREPGCRVAARTARGQARVHHRRVRPEDRRPEPGTDQGRRARRRAADGATEDGGVAARP
jgi:hypothetical protein